jgi:uncharacterized protein (TIGR02145 family)
VAVSGLAVDAGTVTFNVSWDKNNPSDTVWVFVDYNDAGVMKRLPVTGATVSAGTVTKILNNDKGVWVEGNARTNDSFSAKVELLTEVKDLAGACAYASNYPPMGYIATNVITFTGTAPYTVMLEGVPEPQTAGSHYIAPGAIASFTDKTGAPGRIIPGQLQGSCTYTEPAVMGTFANFNPENVGAATYVSLVDERDNKIYPVLKMGDRWMMARNLNYQKNLTWQANSADPSTGIGSNTALIGNFWCPGTSGASASTREACEVYGALYSWETAMLLDGYGTWTEVNTYNTGAANAENSQFNQGRTAHSGNTTDGRGICPLNWHVPTDFEWSVFFDAIEGSGTVHQGDLGGDWFGTNAGKYSKSTCTGAATDNAPLWINHANGGTDVYGFRVLPAGFRVHDGSIYGNLGTTSWFWCSAARSDLHAWYRSLTYDRTTLLRYYASRSDGFSIRCIRD